MTFNIPEPIKWCIGAVAVEAIVKAINTALLLILMLVYYDTSGDLLYIIWGVLGEDLLVPTVLQLALNPPALWVILFFILEYVIAIILVLQFANLAAQYSEALEYLEDIQNAE